MSTIWLEDLHEGWAFCTGEHEMTEADIVAFASQWDPQPFHTDPAAARGTFFEGLSASGWHTAAATMRLYVETVRFGEGSVGIEVDLAWPTPTRPGDVLHVEGRATSVRRSRSKPDRGVVELAYETVNQHGEVRQRTRAKVLVFARGA